MTQIEALRALLGRYPIAGWVVDCDPDPAGSTTTYEPEKRDLELLQPFFDAPLTEDDCYFSVGCGPVRSHYTLKSSTVARARI